MSDKKLTVAQAQKKLAAMNAEYKRLKQQSADLEKQQSDVRTRMHDLNNYFGGEIKCVQRQLEEAKLLEADTARPRAIRDGKPTELVVDKVTDKTIFAREAGTERTIQFRRDSGECTRRWGPLDIDVAATLAEVEKKKAGAT